MCFKSFTSMRSLELCKDLIYLANYCPKSKYRIETPIFTWKNRLFIRISIQIYNDKNDVDYLMKALKTICYI